MMEERRYYTEKHLPLPEDIARLNRYLINSLSTLDYTSSENLNFRRVAGLIEAKLVMYNRRRSGEVQAMRYVSY